MSSNLFSCRSKRARLFLMLVTTSLFLIGLGQAAIAVTDEPGRMPDSFSPLGAAGINSISPYYTATGQVTLSIDGLGTLSSTGIINVDKPAMGIVRAAFLFAASTGGINFVIQDGMMTLEGIPVYWDATVPSSIYSHNYAADVTSVVKPTLDAAAPGLIGMTIDEGANSSAIDGSVLAVIFDVPDMTREYTAILFFGAQNIAGDDFAIGLSEGADPADPEYLLDFSLGISYGFQGSNQSSLIDVNGMRMTSSAGGQDDAVGTADNGALITVGGIGDSNANPIDPFSGPNEDFRQDDEFYNLKPFVSPGDVLINVHTVNPSNDDNIFMGGLLVSGGAIVGEGILLSPNHAVVLVTDSHTLTATVQNTLGERIPGRNVHFEVLSGPNAGLIADVLTDVDGEAFLTYPGTDEGPDFIQASFINSEGLEQVSNTAICDWVRPVATLLRHWNANWLGAHEVELVFGLSLHSDSLTDITLMRQLRDDAGMIRGEQQLWSGPARLVDDGTFNVLARRDDGFGYRDDTSALASTGYAINYTISVATENGENMHFENLAGPGSEPVVPPVTEAALALAPAWPNPANPAVTISFRAAEGEVATVQILDVRGRLVRELHRAAGVGEWQNVMWNGLANDGRAAASGVYLILLKSGQELRTQRVVLAR